LLGACQSAETAQQVETRMGAESSVANADIEAATNTLERYFNTGALD
jgi:hypothetical protein